MRGETNLSTGAKTAGELNFCRCILVVEDDEMIRDLNRDILKHAGYEVDTAENGQTAWDRLQLKEYELMITDQEMPLVTGGELIEKLRGSGQNIPVIMATATMPGEQFALRPAGQADLVLLKPYRPEELLGAVDAVLQANPGYLGGSVWPHKARSQGVQSFYG